MVTHAALTAKVSALLTGLTPGQIQSMAPLDRLQLANECRRIAALADPPRNCEPKVGVLPNLKTTPRDE